MITDIGFWAKLANLAPFLAASVVVVIFLLLILGLIDRFILTRQDIKYKLSEGNLAWAIVLSTLIFSLFYFAGQAIGAPTNEYDRHFRKAVKVYWSTTIDWELSKAQGMQESGLRVHVCSPVGACGILQFMPGTARQFRIDPFDPRASIYAANKYMKWLNRNWSAPRPPGDRYNLALGSYNWGLGSMLRAQKRAERAGSPGNLWAHLLPYLPRETAEYAPRIARWCMKFKRGRPCSIG